MVTTRRQSKSIEPPALPPVAPPKRKRSNNATSVPSAAHPSAESSSKRRRKGKGSASADLYTVATTSTAAVPAAKKTKLSKITRPHEHSVRKRGTDQENEGTCINTSRVDPNGLRRPAYVDLTRDNDSNEDETVQRLRHTIPQNTDDDDADSRYALGSRRKGKARKSTVPAVRRTAELVFEEDGSEGLDKAEAAIASANYRSSLQNNERDSLTWTATKGANMNRENKEIACQFNEKRRDKTKPKGIATSTGVPSKVVMFTVIEAIDELSLYEGGTMSRPAKIDAQTRQPYDPVQTGEYLSYPVKGTYHLGSIGRYGIDSLPPLPFSLTMPLSEHSFIPRSDNRDSAETSRHGLGFDGALSTQSKVPSVRRPNNYCFTFGKYKGRRIDSVPIEYLRSIHDGDEYYNDKKLQQAFQDLYPKGLYESEAESYTFEKGGFKGKRLDEVPKTYLWGLLRKANEDKLPKKGKGRLERALEVWEKNQLDLTGD